MTDILTDYVYSFEAVLLDSTGEGYGVLPAPTGTGTGTCGCVGVGTLPSLAGEGTADWATFGAAELPAVTGDGTTDGYHPAWGAGTLPALVASGAGHVLVESVGLLPPLFGTGACGAVASANLPAITGYALSGYNVTATGDGTIPAMRGEAFVCGIDNAIANDATSAAVVNLLQQGNTEISDAAESICAGLSTDDAKALAVIRYAASTTTYVSDGDGIGDRWTCSLATYQRRYGDCEDGAILAHALLLAAGVNPDRLRTAFGTVLSSSLVSVGHAWLMYRRESDEEWIPLDWTQGAAVYAGALSTIKRQCDLTDSYTKISYILTWERFYAVNDANYIAKLEANRSTGDGILAALTGDGTTCISASGAGKLSALSGSGLCGARGAATLPGVTGTGTAAIESRGTGAATFAALKGSGRVLTGQLVQGDGTLPSLTGTGRATQGPWAQGTGTLPRLHGDGWASPLFAATGDGDLPPLVGRGHAVTPGSLARVLHYDTARWV